MKRLVMLAVALTLVLGMAVSASAAPEVSISGNLLVNAVWSDNWQFRDDNKTNESMRIVQRADLYFTITANENLKGVLGLRSDRGEWGDGDFGLDNPGGADTAQLNIRDAYIDFNWPGTDVNVKAGIYTVALPASVGGASMILAERSGAVMVSAPITDNVSVMAGYTRLFDNNDTTAAVDDDDYADGYLVAVPLNFEGVSLTPYFLYGMLGENFILNAAGTGDDAYAYWYGSNFTMSMFDPFIIKADFNYGTINADTDSNEQSGWMAALGLDYTGFDFMTVSVFGAYTTGDDDDAADGSEQLPVLQGDWAVGSFFFGGGSITADELDNDDGNGQLGFWTIGLSLTDIQSFAQGLTHDFHVLYAKGTNDADIVAPGTVFNGRYLTDEDSLWEVDFNTAYAVYDELTLYGQLGYINGDFDEGTWGAGVKEDAWKVATGVVYKF